MLCKSVAFIATLALNSNSQRLSEKCEALCESIGKCKKSQPVADKNTGDKCIFTREQDGKYDFFVASADEESVPVKASLNNFCKSQCDALSSFGCNTSLCVNNECLGIYLYDEKKGKVCSGTMEECEGKAPLPCDFQEKKKKDSYRKKAVEVTVEEPARRRVNVRKEHKHRPQYYRNVDRFYFDDDFESFLFNEYFDNLLPVEKRAVKVEGVLDSDEFVPAEFKGQEDLWKKGHKLDNGRLVKDADFDTFFPGARKEDYVVTSRFGRRFGRGFTKIRRELYLDYSLAKTYRREAPQSPVNDQAPVTADSWNRRGGKFVDDFFNTIRPLLGNEIQKGPYAIDNKTFGVAPSANVWPGRFKGITNAWDEARIGTKVGNDFYCDTVQCSPDTNIYKAWAERTINALRKFDVEGRRDEYIQTLGNLRELVKNNSAVLKNFDIYNPMNDFINKAVTAYGL